MDICITCEREKYCGMQAKHLGHGDRCVIHGPGFHFEHPKRDRASIEQQVQLDSEQKQGTFYNPVDAAVSVAPRELT